MNPFIWSAIGQAGTAYTDAMQRLGEQKQKKQQQELQSQALQEQIEAARQSRIEAARKAAEDRERWELEKDMPIVAQMKDYLSGADKANGAGDEPTANALMARAAGLRGQLSQSTLDRAGLGATEYPALPKAAMSPEAQMAFAGSVAKATGSDVSRQYGEAALKAGGIQMPPTAPAEVSTAPPPSPAPQLGMPPAPGSMELSIAPPQPPPVPEEPLLVPTAAERGRLLTDRRLRDIHADRMALEAAKLAVQVARGDRDAASSLATLSFARQRHLNALGVPADDPELAEIQGHIASATGLLATPMEAREEPGPTEAGVLPPPEGTRPMPLTMRPGVRLPAKTGISPGAGPSVKKVAPSGPMYKQRPAMTVQQSTAAKRAADALTEQKRYHKATEAQRVAKTPAGGTTRALSKVNNEALLKARAAAWRMLDKWRRWTGLPDPDGAKARKMVATIQAELSRVNKELGIAEGPAEQQRGMDSGIRFTGKEAPRQIREALDAGKTIQQIIDASNWNIDAIYAVYDEWKKSRGRK